MLYRPNFCCNCGEKIDRIDWHLTVSRRFCDACAVENRRYEYAPRFVLAAGALALMFGLGSLWGGSGQPGQGAAGVSPAAFETSVQTQESQKARTLTDRSVPSAPNQGDALVLPPPAEIVSAEPKLTESKFFCGALTKKGTPCSRKVKTRGTRCYQHEGRPQAPPLN